MRIEELTPIALLAAGFSGGCTSRPEPAFASSANETSYAERYPATLLALRTEYASDEAKAKDIFGGFSNYPGALTNPDGEQVLAVVTRADAAGKSGSYAEQMEGNQSTSRLFSEEEDTLNQKVGGAAQYTA